MTPLSPREYEVAALVTKGLTDKEIAWQMGTSKYTVKTQVSMVKAKIGVETRVEVAVWVTERRLK
jgi:non-specific serine/threonine protein kinase